MATIAGSRRVWLRCTGLRGFEAHRAGGVAFDEVAAVVVADGDEHRAYSAS